MPEGWVIDSTSRRHLARTLECAGQHISGVVAEVALLPPGSSYRVVAERRALGPPRTSVTSHLEVEGAVLLRPGSTFELRDGAVLVGDGALLVDHGASAHDPWRALDDIEEASPDGRPPFTYRPTVVFLGLEPDPDLADWVRRSVNNLVRRSTEGRIAVPQPTGGLHLTSPCAPVEASIAALRPDVVIALDRAASDVAARWSGADRSAVVIELSQDTTEAVELVSWQIGRAHGRLRARVGRGIGAVALEDLVRRLCAGPQPLPPGEAAQGGLRIRPRRRSKRRASSLVALVAAPSTAQAARYAALAEHVAARGSRLTVSRVADGPPPETARTADVVVVSGLSGSSPVHDLSELRRASGLSTVVDLGSQDLRRQGHVLRAPSLSPEALSLVRTCGAASTTSTKVQESLTDLGIRCLVLPTLLSEAHADRLRTLRGAHVTESATVLGWHTGAAGDPGDDTETIPLDLLADLLDRRTDLTVELVGNNTRLARSLARHPRLTVDQGDPPAGSILRWRAQVWAPLATQAIGGEDVRAVVDAHHLGVPTVVAASSQPAIEGLVPAALTLGGSGRSLGLVGQLLDGDRLWRHWSDAVVQLSASLDAPSTSASVANRFLGWLSSEDRS